MPPIVDAHHHLWDLSLGKHPWLLDRPAAEFRYGNYSRLKRDYLPADYRRDTAGFDVTQSVYVEAEWDPSDPVGEVRWVEKIAAEEGFPNAMVAQAWLDREDIGELARIYRDSALVRSVRHKPRSAPTPDDVVIGAPGSMQDPRWRRGFALLADAGLSFDLQTPWWHLPEAARLAHDHPRTAIILNHTGLPADRTAEGLQQWRRAMERVAEEENVFVKISGLGVPGAAWTPDANRHIVRTTIDLFGIDRCMFASNFPVDGLVASFDTIMNGFLEITSDMNAQERQKLFHDNAVRVYRVE